MSDWLHLSNEISGKERGADYIIDSLYETGVDYLFGLPADSINALFDAVRKNSNLRMITCRHESNGALMASAYAKLSMRPAAISATNGPGVGHLPLGCRDAFLDEVPMIVLPGTVNHAMAGLRTFQDLDGQRLLEPWTDGVFRCESVSGLSRLDVLISRAVESRRPVAFLPSPEVLMSSTGGTKRTTRRKPRKPGSWSSSQKDIDRAEQIIATAHTLAVIVSDTRFAPDGIVDRAMKVGLLAPSAIQSPHWSRIRTQYRIFCGMHVDDWLSDVDTVLVVGSWPGELKELLKSKKVVHFTEQPSWRVNCTSYVNVCGCSAQQVWLDAVDKVSEIPKYVKTDVSNCVVLEKFDPLLGDSAVIAVEPHILPTVIVGLSERNRKFTSSFNASTVGYAIPAAIAGALAFPGRLGVAVVDRLGWTESQTEICTARKHGIDVALLYFANDAADAEKYKSEAAAFGLKVVEGWNPSSPRKLRAGETLVILEDNLFASRPASSLFRKPLDVERYVNFSSAQQYDGTISAESIALGEVAWAKSTGKVACLEIDDEAIFLRCINALADAAMDGASIVLITHESHWTYGSDKITSGLSSVELIGTSRDLDSLVVEAVSIADSINTIVHVRLLSSACEVNCRQSNFRSSNVQNVPLPSKDSLDLIENLLRRASRPIILVGGGVQDPNMIESLACLLNAPVVATMAAASCDGLPTFAGYVGSSGHFTSNQALGNADVVLMLGVSNRGFAFQLVGGSAQIIDINNDIEVLACRSEVDLSVQADCSSVVRGLLSRNVSSRDGNGQEVVKRQDSWWLSNSGKTTLYGRLRPSYVVKTLGRATQSRNDVVFTADVGINTLWLLRYLRRHERTQWTRNFATMGFGLPAAITRAEDTNLPTIAVIGDGGMGMSTSAFGLAKYAPVLCVVLNNDGLAAIRYEQEILGWPEFESGLFNPDFAALARAWGWSGRTVTTDTELNSSIHEFLKDPKPTILNVICTKHEPPMPALSPRGASIASAVFAWARQGRKGVVSAVTAMQALVGDAYDRKYRR